MTALCAVQRSAGFYFRCEIQLLLWCTCRQALEADIANFGAGRDARIKAARDRQKQAKAAVEAARRALKQAEQARAG